jgi:signal transduction histidine kinase
MAEERARATAPEVITVEELVASVALELNGPLTNIAISASACLRFLAGDAPNVEEAREAVHEIVRDAKRACEAFLRIQALNKSNSLREGSSDRSTPAPGAGS